MIYVGDAEVGLFDLLSMWENVREHGLTVEEGVQIAQKDFDFIFCPSLYRPVYDKEKFVEWRPKHRSSAGKPVYPTTIKRVACKDLDKAPKYTRPLPSYTDTTMGLGEVEVSRGCRGACMFCGIGWKYRPYRERSVDVMVKALSENRREGGGVSLCPIATEFAYYSWKRELVGKLSEISTFVDPLSMRVDAFASDPEFDRFLGKRGMNQLALGVEAVSQRLRNRLRKGVTEEQILKACQIAIEAKFKRIKFFMISNIDEEWKDFEEFFALLRKVRLLEKKGMKIEITASWTPLFVEPCTPLQWKKPTIEQRKNWSKVDDILMGEKYYVGKKMKRRDDGLAVNFSLGIKNEENFLWMMQGMHLGDTRFAEAVAVASEQLKRPFYVAFARNTKETVSRVLKKTGGSWDYIMRERSLEEKFPWDIVDRGVPKATLLNLYRHMKAGKYDTEPLNLPVVRDETPFPSGFCGEQSVYAWYLFKYEVERGFEIVPNTHWRAQLHRAAWKAGLPISTNRVHFFSDRDNKNWFGGIDYVGIAFRKEIKESEAVQMNEHLIGMRLLRCRRVSVKVGEPPRWGSWHSVYQVETDLKHEEVMECIKRFHAAKRFEIRQPETRYFSGVRKKKIELKKEAFVCVRLIQRMGLTSVGLEIELSPNVEIRPFLNGFLQGVSAKRILKYDVKKLRIKDTTGRQEGW